MLFTELQKYIFITHWMSLSYYIWISQRISHPHKKQAMKTVLLISESLQSQNQWNNSLIWTLNLALPAYGFHLTDTLHISWLSWLFSMITISRLEQKLPTFQQMFQMRIRQLHSTYKNLSLYIKISIILTIWTISITDYLCIIDFLLASSIKKVH